MSSDIAAECYHGVLGWREAEARLKASGLDNCYLTRRSDTKATYILSYVIERDSEPCHIIVPSISTRKRKNVRYEDLGEVVENLIHGRDHCRVPIYPPTHTTSSNVSEGDRMMCDADDNNNDCDSLGGGSAVSDQHDTAHATTAKHAEVYFNLLCSVEPSRLKLTASQELDDRIYTEFKQSFPDLNVAKFVEDDIKNEKAKTEWRKFSEGFKDVEDYSLGCLLRLDSGKDYTEENTVIAIKIQFFAIEIARNRDGCNDSLRTNFKPTKRTARGGSKAARSEPGPDAAPPGPGPTMITQNGVNMSEVEFELQQIFGGTHPLLKS